MTTNSSLDTSSADNKQLVQQLLELEIDFAVAHPPSASAADETAVFFFGGKYPHSDNSTTAIQRYDKKDGTLSQREMGVKVDDNESRKLTLLLIIIIITCSHYLLWYYIVFL